MVLKYIPINDTYSELSVLWPSDTEIPDHRTEVF